MAATRITTSSSSAPGRAAGRSPTGWPPSGKRILHPRARRTTCRASGTTGTPPRSSSRASTAPRSSGTTRTATSSRPEVNYYVGGNTKFYGAALFRLRPEDFGEIRHHGGVSPAWPIGYADLEPYYTQAEHLYRVHGRHGEDPTEGPASAQYLHAPVQHEPRIQQLSDDLEKQGLHPFHLPIGVDLTQDEEGRATRASACIRCDRVDGFPCLVGAKSDAQVICVDPALEHDNVTMLTDAHVQRLETDATGRTVTRVVAELDDGSTGRLQRRRRRRRLRGRQLGGAAAAIGPNDSTRTGWPTARTWSAVTTCGTTTSR